MRRFILFLFSILAASTCNAATHYVLDGGSGDGSAWNNALDDLPAALTRGDTYYIGDGAYAAYTFDDAESGTSYITLKKATVADHGTETGWDNAYGDGTATWSSTTVSVPVWQISNGFYEFDGQVGYFKGADEAHGFILYRENNGSIIRADEDFSGTNVNFRHIKLYTPDAYANRGAGFDFSSTSGSSHFENVLVEYCYISHVALPFTFLSTATNDENSNHVTIQYSVADWNFSDAVLYHSELASIRSIDNLVVRYCWFEDIEGTGGFVNLSNPGPTESTAWAFYGNIWTVTAARKAYLDGDTYPFDGVGNTIGTNQTNTSDLNNSVVYNNTITLDNGLNAGCGDFFSSGSTGNTIKNNLYWSVDGVRRQNATISYDARYDADTVFGDDGSDNEIVSTGDPFIYSGGQNFSLAEAITGEAVSDVALAVYDGTGTLGSNTFTVDGTPKLLGGEAASNVVRGDDEIWDVGAIERKTGGDPPDSDPTDLAVTTTWPGGLTLTWTDNASDEAAYRVERSAHGAATWSTAATVAADAETATITFQAAADWDWRVLAVGSTGEPSSPTATVNQAIVAAQAAQGSAAVGVGLF